MGEAGVTRALEILHKELDVTMAFCGHTDIRGVDRRVLLPGTYTEAIHHMCQLQEHRSRGLEAA